MHLQRRNDDTLTTRILSYFLNRRPLALLISVHRGFLVMIIFIINSNIFHNRISLIEIETRVVSNFVLQVKFKKTHWRLTFVTLYWGKKPWQTEARRCKLHTERPCQPGLFALLSGGDTVIHWDTAPITIVNLFLTDFSVSFAMDLMVSFKSLWNILTFPLVTASHVF